MTDSLFNHIVNKMDSIEAQLNELEVLKADLKHEYKVLAELIGLNGLDENRGTTVTDMGIVEELPVEDLDG